MKRLRLRRFGRSASGDKPEDATAKNDLVKYIVDTVAGVKKKPDSAPKPVPMRASRDPLGLTARQGLFLREYLICNNATAAAKKAGYSAKTAAAQGARLLTKASIADEIRKRRAAVIEKLDITADAVQTELGRCGFFNIIDCMKFGTDGEVNFDLSELTREQAAALGEVTIEEFTDGRSDKRQVRRIKVKPTDKIAALTLLGKNLGMFAENHKHQHSHTVVGLLLDEIDQASRGDNAKVIEQVPDRE